ncbi:MAG: hypothetical protein KatS3mg077_0940 [Candidatus Binatia bacterium]|nr:MAG: hypothetical protein KatS3mg077_0940 [Candidatus Binatia bacterium]
MHPSASPRPIRVILADDHVLIRSRVRALLESTSGFEVVAEVSDGPTAVAEVQRLCPDLALIDLSLPYLDGIETTVTIRQLCPKVRVVVLSAHDDATYARRALLLGASAFLPKPSLERTMFATIRNVLSSPLSPLPGHESVHPVTHNNQIASLHRARAQKDVKALPSKMVVGLASSLRLWEQWRSVLRLLRR